MSAVGAPDCRDVESVLTGRQPVADLRPDYAAPAAPLTRFGLAWLAGHDQHHPRAHRLGLGQTPVEPCMGGIQRRAVQVERDVRMHQPASQLAVPARIETQLAEGTGFRTLR